MYLYFHFGHEKKKACEKTIKDEEGCVCETICILRSHPGSQSQDPKV